MFANHLFAFEGKQAIRVQTARELLETDLPAAMQLLAENPLRAVHLRGMLLDNGLSHPSNRGRFYGYFENHQLVGIALLGHATMLYIRPEAEAEALRYFAQQVVENNLTCNVVFGPKAQVEAFGAHLTELGRATKMVRDFGWFVCTKAKQPVASLQIQRANLEELEPVATAQAEMFKEATGTDPRVADPEGFVRRVAERIERHRTWIKLDAGEVVFKTELQCVTPEAVYLEGVWTREGQREKGVATNCLNELMHRLLKQHSMLCLAVEPEEEAARKLYEQVGFQYAEEYQARYLKPAESK
ncbi:MAG: GNAT family N-acetyltransferase [Blastocatellia bacterium]|nr:GNAT family N-acetyltransferase [Blastocatellia bacterium]